MKNKRILVLICFIVCILFAISSVNAGIFEFAEDNGDVDDSLNQDIDEENEDYEIKEFEIKSLKSTPVLDVLGDLQDSIDEGDSDDFDTVYWLTDLMDYILFEDEDGDCVIVNESDADKIPSSSKYSSCTIECKVIDSHFGDGCNYYLVKDIKVIKKVKKSNKSSSSSSKSSSQDSYSSSSSSSSSSKSSSSSNSNSQSYSYVGNAATGKFHDYYCRDVEKMDQSNMVFFGSRDEAINHGYVPCGHCKP